MKTTEYVKNAGHVHTKHYGELEGTWRSHIVCRSERHAGRLVHLLNWYDRSGYPGGFFRRTWYDARKKRLITSAGYDI